MQRYKYPTPEMLKKILQRPLIDNASLEGTVSAILNEVKMNGDQAVQKYTLQFDKVQLEKLSVSEEEFIIAEKLVDDSLKQAIQVAKNNIEKFHQSQLSSRTIIETMQGVQCWQKTMPIDRVGLYIPGGTAPLFSTVLMLGVPAKIAGCSEIVMCTPPQKDDTVNPVVLYTAKLVGIDKVFKIGGVQAVGAMAYGTATVPAVYKIFGPGNQYVTAAKQLINKEGIAIDMPAGPSEVLVLADDNADADFVAADLLSQAEHGIDSQVVLVAYDDSFVNQVLEAIEQQLIDLPRKNIARAALENSIAITVENEEKALTLINEYAPEHLILATNNSETLAEKITNAGSVFIGNYTPESVGDYASGTNHTLPTNGFAKAYSGVNLDAFVKKITFQKLSKEGLQNIGNIVEQMAAAEQLIAHKNAVSIRLKKIANNEC